ncbi:MAG: hypothetical protein IZT58_14115 [Actinobacteria bacterium]|nr:hypothetical protein [Actinomycetota bacterium]
MAAKFFGKSRSDADDDVQGENKLTRFLFDAANTGNYKDASTLVSADFSAYVNGNQMGPDDVKKGPKVLTEVLHYYDEHIVDSFWQLYDEVDQVDRLGAGMIAIRFLAKGEFSGDRKQVEMAGFLTVADSKLSEFRIVTDLAVFNSMRESVGLPTLD